MPPEASGSASKSGQRRLGSEWPVPRASKHDQLSTEPLDLSAERRVVGRDSQIPPDIEDRIWSGRSVPRFHPCDEQVERASVGRCMMREDRQPPARDVDEDDRGDLDGTVHRREVGRNESGVPASGVHDRAREREGEQDGNPRPDGSAFVASGTFVTLPAKGST